MAKINQVKLKKDADDFERAGRIDKAIDALKQIVQENTRDWATVNRIGDLYGKLSNPKAANEHYVKVAKYFAEDGFYLKAIAVWKKVLRNDPAMLEGKTSLGELYQKQGLGAEARQTFAEVYEEYKKRNKLREAGEVLRRMAEVDPGDMKVRILLAELYGREGDPEKAAAEFAGIAEELVKKGLLAEALQLLDKALRGGQRSPRLLTAAARVHLVQKDFAGAVALLEEARRAAPGDRDIALRLAEACVGARRGDDARAVLQSLLERDAGDQEARQQLAYVYLSEGRHDEAFEQALPVVDRLVERRQADRAAALLQQIVQKNPAHVRSLAKLVEIYRLSRNDLLVAQTYSLMVEAYLAEGRQDQAASVLEMLVQLDPTNEQHRTKLKWLRDQQESAGFDVDLAQPAPAPVVVPQRVAPPVPRGVELSGPLSAEDQEFIGEHLAEGRVFRKYGLGDKARDQFEAVLSRFPDNTDALQELSDQLREKGENAAAAQRLRVLAEVLRLKGDAAQAARVDADADALAGPAASPAAAPVVPAPQPVAATSPAARAAAVAELSSFIPASFEPPAAPVLVEPPAHGGGPALDVDIDVEDAESPAGDDPDFDLGVVAEQADDHPQRFDESELGPPGGEIGGQFIDEETPAGAAGFDLSDATIASPELAEEATAPFPSIAAPRSASPLATPAAPAPAQLVVPSPAAQAAVGEVPAELRRALDEIDSFVALGFADDAKRVLAGVAPRFAGHAALLQRVSQLGLELPDAFAAESAADDFVLVDGDASGPPPAATPLASEEPLQLSADFLGIGGEPEDEEAEPAGELAGFAAAPATPEPAAVWAPAGFDLSAELGDLFGAQPAMGGEEAAATGTDLGDASLADIFREFQKGVEKQLGKEDYETRYNLGIAYKEMGLVDEAIAEFQLAAKDDGRLLECASMLGICFLEKGMPKLAVKWFEKGLQAPGRSEDEYQALRYDLASALEQAGEGDRAAELFTELYGQNSQFRDVAEKVRRLGR